MSAFEILFHVQHYALIIYSVHTPCMDGPIYGEAEDQVQS